MAKLAEVNPYFFPGPPLHDSFTVPNNPIPLAASEGADDLEAIMSNRRFRKVVGDLGKMEKSAVAKLINKELATALDEYQQFYDEYATMKDPMLADDGTPRSGSSVAMTIQTPDGKTVMTGARLKVLALAWIAGMLELDDCRTQIGQVADLALQQRTNFYEHPNWSPTFRADMVARISLFNRQILGTALAGVTRNRAAVSDSIEQADVSWQTRDLVSYLATQTEYDHAVFRDGLTPDGSKGSRTYRYLSPMSDETFDGLRAKLRAVR